MSKTMTPQEINELLRSTRDQAFRKKPQQYIDVANNSRAHNLLNYGKGTYILRSPGNDLLDFYDTQMLNLDSTSKAFSKIPPSVVYHYRFEHEYPAELFDKSKNYGRYAYLRDQLSNYFVSADNTYWSQVYYTRMKWLVDKPHKEYKFKLKSEVDDFALKQFGQKISHKLATQKASKQLKIPVHQTMFWRGKVAGWSIIYVEN